MSDFAGLSIASSALFANRRALETIGHNVSNSNTAGYSRQRVELQAIPGSVYPGVTSNYKGGGQGVQVVDVTRFRDQFLEIRAALEHAAGAQSNQMKSTLSSLEQLFNEPSDQSISQNLSDFWSAWDDVANNPDDGAARQEVLQRAGTIAMTFNQTSSRISGMRADAISTLTSTIADVNTIANNVAQLNDKIRIAVATGIDANDLKDQRDVLVGQLAEKVGATARPVANGVVDVYVNGTTLVSGNRAESLSVDSSGTPVVVRWAQNNRAATVTSGDAGGLLDVINTTLPAYSTDLDTIANALRDQVNAVHAAIGGSIATTAQDQSAAGNLQFQIALNGGASAVATVAGANWSGAGGAAALQAALQAAVNGSIGAGNATVTVSGGNGSPMTVSVAPTGTNTLQVQAQGANAGFSVLLGTTAVGLDGVGGRAFFTTTSTGAADLAVDPTVAASSNAVAAGTPTGGPLDGSIALTLADQATSTSGADSRYKSFIVALGSHSQNAQRLADMQSATVQQIDGQRQSYSGVSIDEEMAAMVQYQKAYEASARFLTAVDQILDTLVNRTGLAGR